MLGTLYGDLVACSFKQNGKKLFNNVFALVGLAGGEGQLKVILSRVWWIRLIIWVVPFYWFRTDNIVIQPLLKIDSWKEFN